MIIQHNIAALNSHRQLGINNANTNKNLEKLSSGYRINRAGDDAAGLAISEKMRGQIRGLSQAEMNTSHAINLIQTAEGGLQETHAILQRMRELAVQSSNGTYDNDVDRANLEKEYTALMEEINRISSSTHYNGIQLLDGSSGCIDGSAVATEAGGIALADLGFDLSATIDVSYTDVGEAGAAYAGKEATIIVRDDGSYVLRIGDEYFEGTGSGTVTFELADDGVNPSEVEITIAAPAGTVGTVTFTITGNTSDSIALADTKVAALNHTEVTFQIGANGTADQRVGTYVQNMSSYSLGDGATFITDTTISIPRNDGTNDGANEAIAVIDAAINQVSGVRADLGALQNRLEHTMNNLGVTKENLTAAESTIRDVDMAKEMMEYTKNTILVQASQAMLAQAQTLPQGVLNLLR